MIKFIVMYSKRKNKRFVGIFLDIKKDKIIRIHFGLKGGSTYIDHKDDKKKENYIKRHNVNENWNNPYSAGALSRYILWNKKKLSESIEDFKNRFNFN